jgi:hypothetical protein
VLLVEVRQRDTTGRFGGAGVPEQITHSEILNILFHS